MWKLLWSNYQVTCYKDTQSVLLKSVSRFKGGSAIPHLHTSCFVTYLSLSQWKQKGQYQNMTIYPLEWLECNLKFENSGSKCEAIGIQNEKQKTFCFGQKLIQASWNSEQGLFSAKWIGSQINVLIYIKEIKQKNKSI